MYRDTQIRVRIRNRAQAELLVYRDISDAEIEDPRSAAAFVGVVIRDIVIQADRAVHENGWILPTRAEFDLEFPEDAG